MRYLRRKQMNLSVVGLGKLGSPMVACFAAKGHKTIGVDLNPHFVEAINQGKAPVFEPDLQDMIDRGRANLSATTDIVQAVLDTEATFIIVPTPSESGGAFPWLMPSRPPRALVKDSAKRTPSIWLY